MGIINRLRKARNNQRHKQANDLGYSSFYEMDMARNKARDEAIKEIKAKKRKQDLARVKKEAGLTRTQKTQRTMQSIRKNVETFQKTSNVVFGNSNQRTTKPKPYKWDSSKFF